MNVWRDGSDITGLTVNAWNASGITGLTVNAWNASDITGVAGERVDKLPPQGWQANVCRCDSTQGASPHTVGMRTNAERGLLFDRGNQQRRYGTLPGECFLS